ncbi:DUF29 domain-containing protein [Pannus brasiliensis CCIBt3594]|uniref:DUF29 domain-containing protein n=1 Tax=Pannus brasiliensis CCIBt3594 TaxID=1427578 RepID=A0AAW9QWU8_9CHRO
MTARIDSPPRTLYEQDYALWLKTTVEQLRSGRLAELDIENLIEELEGMSRSDKRSLESLLIRLLEHLLKLAYWESERERNGNHWSAEITNFRYQISKLLADSPSLKPYLEQIFEEAHAVARRSVSRSMKVNIDTLPENPIAPIEQILDDNWLPVEKEL